MPRCRRPAASVRVADLRSPHRSRTSPQRWARRPDPCRRGCRRPSAASPPLARSTLERSRPERCLASGTVSSASSGAVDLSHAAAPEDLKLGQAVALKFLPKAVSGDEALLARFHAEVRLARQVSHPNVCRIYDIGEIEGRHFLSMEYVDGEDLASLLKLSLIHI